MTPQLENSTMKPTIDTELEGGVELYRIRQQTLAKRLPKRTREMQNILTHYRELQRKLLKSPNIEDPYPYKHTYIFYCLTLTEKT
jgi:hypothetical protein